jgi:hypothetical protein
VHQAIIGYQSLGMGAFARPRWPQQDDISRCHGYNTLLAYDRKPR